MNPELQSDLLHFGAIEANIKWLDKPRKDNIDYLDLVHQEKVHFKKPLPVSLEAVVESESNALAYVVKAESLARSPEQSKLLINQLRHDLSCRGDAEYLAIWRTGELEIVRLGLSKTIPKSKCVTPKDNPFLFQEMINGILDPQKEAVNKAVHRLLFKVLTEVSSALEKSPAFEDNKGDVISLVGRALFTRFLIDRGIINEQTFRELYEDSNPDYCFDSPEKAALVCAWLKDKFNGDLLPLTNDNYDDYFTQVHRNDPNVFFHLGNILHKSPGGQKSFEDYWRTINFAHVPIGLLSQVYETHAHAFNQKSAKAESIYYTPRYIAEYMVNQAFDGMDNCVPDQAKVLDPAAGAGIFLTLCFRRLVYERWNATNERPDHKVIRDILKEQIFGFDINEWALRLTALSLYLTALELDPDPYPPSKLKFRKLMKQNLFETRGKGEEFPKTLVMGSLGDGCPKGHEKKYDLVIGNPPWTAWKADGSNELNIKVSNLVRDIAAARGQSEALNQIARSYNNPDKVPDLPFVWKATEWAKPNAIIAFALHGRLLFKRSRQGSQARNALFKALRITGIFNGSRLSGSVWPGMSEPFCLLFALNSVPDIRDSFRFITPDRDDEIEKKGRIRIDYAAAQPVQTSVMENTPSILRTLSEGTSLDADVVYRINEKIQADNDFTKLGDYWTEGNGLSSCQGFRIAKDQKQEPSQFIIDMGAKELHKDDADIFCIDDSVLSRFSRKTLHTPRYREAYLAPLVLINESPGETRDSIRANLYLGETPLAFTQSFFGYSSYNYDDAKNIARYLFVLCNSDLFVFYILMTSAKFAVRRVLYKEDLNDFPILRFESLSKTIIQKINDLSSSLCREPGKEVWDKINELVFSIYGLDQKDRQIVADTLATRLPYDKTRKYATTYPSQILIDSYLSALTEELNPTFRTVGDSIKCSVKEYNQSQPWIFFDIQNEAYFQKSNSTHFILEKYTQELANNQGATRIIIRGEQGHLCVGVLAQNRFFTISRAYLLAFDILRSYRDQFPIPESCE